MTTTAETERRQRYMRNLALDIAEHLRIGGEDLRNPTLLRAAIEDRWWEMWPTLQYRWDQSYPDHREGAHPLSAGASDEDVAYVVDRAVEYYRR